MKAAALPAAQSGISLSVKQSQLAATSYSRNPCESPRVQAEQPESIRDKESENIFSIKYDALFAKSVIIDGECAVVP